MRRLVHLGMSLLLTSLIWACVDSGPACLNPQPDLPSCSRASVAAAPTGTVPGTSGESTGGSAAIDLGQGAGSPAPSGSFGTGGSQSPTFPSGLGSAGAHQGGAAGGPATNEIMSGGSAGRGTEP